MRFQLRPLPLLVATLLWGLSSGQSERAVALSMLMLWACIRPARWALTVPAQVLAALAVAMLVLFLQAIDPNGPGFGGVEMEPLWFQVGEWALVFSVLRLHFRQPALGQSGTLGLGLLVFLACGTVRIGSLYPFLLGVFAFLSFISLHYEEVAQGGRPAGGVNGKRTAAVAAGLLAIALLSTLALADAVPRFYSLAYSWAVQWVDDRQRAGFHDGPITLRSLDGLLQSDEVVLRVQGEAGERLRGNVYTHYARGRWLPPPRPREENIRFDWADPTIEVGQGARAVIRYARDGADRYFIPSDGGRLALAPANARVDEMGVVRVSGRDAVERIAVFGSGEFPLAIHPPRQADYEVPEELRALLESFTADWIRPGASPLERVEAIREHLEVAYTYSLTPSGSSDREALAEFLTQTRAGHCEYFATALVLLSRVAGVPARLVTGYRVAEWNPFGSYAVVREKHAHAWAEIYLEDPGWVSVDPSPLRSGAREMAALTPWVEGLWDWILFGLQRRGLETLLIILIAGLAAVQVVRLLRRRTAPKASRSPDFAVPPPWLSDFLETLARRGLSRGPSESLESFARRLRRCSDSAAPLHLNLVEAALLLRRYSALRYGGEGNEAMIRQDFQRWLEHETSESVSKFKSPSL
ncbi:MAG: transglutaminase domain-containing protein [Myxococcota bacterium]|nr:transglutaminase domain-containing protein [Myxococcota bacterium]